MFKLHVMLESSLIACYQTASTLVIPIICLRLTVKRMFVVQAAMKRRLSARTCELVCIVPSFPRHVHASQNVFVLFYFILFIYTTKHRTAELLRFNEIASKVVSPLWLPSCCRSVPSGTPWPTRLRRRSSLGYCRPRSCRSDCTWLSMRASTIHRFPSLCALPQTWPRLRHPAFAALVLFFAFPMVIENKRSPSAMLSYSQHVFVCCHHSLGGARDSYTDESKSTCMN